MQFALAYLGLRTFFGAKVASALNSMYIFWVFWTFHAVAAADVLLEYLVMDTILNLAEGTLEADILLHHAATIVLLSHNDDRLGVLFYMELTTPLIQILRLLPKNSHEAYEFLRILVFPFVSLLWIPTRIALPIVLLRYYHGVTFACIFTLLCLNLYWFGVLVGRFAGAFGHA